MSREERNKLIFHCMVKCAKEKGLFRFTIMDVSKCAQCSMALVKIHFGGIVNMRSLVAHHAKEHGIKEISDAPITDLLIY